MFTEQEFKIFVSASIVIIGSGGLLLAFIVRWIMLCHNILCDEHEKLKERVKNIEGIEGINITTPSA